MRLIKLIGISFIVIFIIAILHTLPGYIWDMYYWRDWTVHIHEHGLSDVYSSGTDYLPLYHYILYLYGHIAGSEEEIWLRLPYLRIATLVFDMIGVWYIYKWINRRIDLLIIFSLCILNISYSYNSLIWGQVDGIFTTCVFVSFYYAFYNRPVLSAVLFLIALNFKLQAIVFLPIWGILFFNNILTTKNVKTLLYPLVAVVLVQVLILMPFIINGSLKEIYGVVTGSVDRYPVLTMGAKNIWSFIFMGETRKVPDSGMLFANITYKQAGIYMFFSASFVALLPMIIQTWKRIKDRNNKKLIFTREQIWLTAALVSILAYFLNTQMHERYVHPAFIFIAAYTFHTGKAFPFIMFSITYLLTLEDVMRFFNLSNYETLIFNDVFIAGLYVVIIAYLGIQLFKAFYRRREGFEQLKEQID